MMYPIIVLFFEITILRKGPQDVPYSGLLLNLTALVYMVVNLLILLSNEEWWIAVLQILLEFLLILAFSWPLLYFSGKSTRFMQTLCALLGTDAVISFLAIPAFVGQNPPIIAVLMIWHLVVSGHIYRHSLDKPWFFGLGLAFLFRLISSQLMMLLFPVLSVQS